MVSQRYRVTVVGMKEGGARDHTERDEIPLLEEELVQLTVKSSKVVLDENRTLICSL